MSLNDVTGRRRAIELFHAIVLLTAVPASVGARETERHSGDGLFSTSRVSGLTIKLDASALASLRLHPRAYVKGTVVEASERESVERGKTAAGSTPLPSPL